MTNKKKKQYGQYYTIYDAFNHEPFKKWFNKVLKASNNKVLEPFAGENNIINLLKDIWKNKDIDYVSYDIFPYKGVIKRDTLKNFPTQHIDRVIVTNPPYLSRVSAKRRKLEFPNNIQYNNLYKIALDIMLKNNDYVAAIIPASFLNSREHELKNRLEAAIILNKNLFIDTAQPVILALFSKENQKNKEVYIQDGDGNFLNKISLETALKWYFNRYKNNKKRNINFNIQKGNLFLYGIDSSNHKKISFRIPSTKDQSIIMKISSRNLSLIEVDIKVTLKFIDFLNKEIEEYRKQTCDILLNPFLSRNSENEIRRRMDYKTARKIIEKAIEKYEHKK